jgi:hypothetical protein
MLRFWSIALSAVLAITMLQVAPPAKAAPASPQCDPTSRTAFDGEALSLIYDFTVEGACEWNPLPDLTDAKIAIVAGGDGGTESSAGLGGEVVF